MEYPYREYLHNKKRANAIRRRRKRRKRHGKHVKKNQVLKNKNEKKIMKKKNEFENKIMDFEGKWIIKLTTNSQSGTKAI